MNQTKIGTLIYQLRKEKNWTQLQLANQMGLSDKTISKWERGLGCPDISLLTHLSDIFDIDLEKLLTGDLDSNDPVGGNMKKTQFYICPHCHNLITAMTDTTITCCGKKLKAIPPQKAEDQQKLNVELIENQYYITSDHEMTKENYITFVALLTGDSIMLRKQYPEWNLQTRIPAFAHGILLWNCTCHGLRYQII